MDKTFGCLGLRTGVLVILIVDLSLAMGAMSLTLFLYLTSDSLVSDMNFLSRLFFTSMALFGTVAFIVKNNTSMAIYLSYYVMRLVIQGFGWLLLFMSLLDNNGTGTPADDSLDSELEYSTHPNMTWTSLGMQLSYTDIVSEVHQHHSNSYQGPLTHRVKSFYTVLLAFFLILRIYFYSVLLSYYESKQYVSEVESRSSEPPAYAA